MLEPLIWLLVACLVLFALWAGYSVVTTPANVLPQQAIIFAAILATAGWLVSAYVARRNSIKQHTMAVLTQARLSPVMIGHIHALYDKFPGETPMDEEFFKQTATTDPVIRGSFYVLNYYEFLAVALRHGDLGSVGIQDSLPGLIVIQALDGPIRFD